MYYHNKSGSSGQSNVFPVSKEIPFVRTKHPKVSQFLQGIFTRMSSCKEI